MDLQQRIDADIRAAMLAREKDRLNALRAIKSAILLELTKEGAQAGLEESAGLKILQKLYKQRQESAAIYHQQGRADLAQEEEVQAAVIEAYLPQRMSEDEIEAMTQEKYDLLDEIESLRCAIDTLDLKSQAEQANHDMTIAAEVINTTKRTMSDRRVRNTVFTSP